MSFSKKVKEELSFQLPQKRHCMIAEITAIISFLGRILITTSGRYSVKIQTENIYIARKYFTLVKKAFNIDSEITIRQNVYLKNSRTYIITVNDNEDALRILKETRLIDKNWEINENLSIVSNEVVKGDCCKRSYLRGAFLSAGSISEPEKSYHLEMVCQTMEKAVWLKDLIKVFDIEAKITGRKKNFVVYIKEGEGIVDMLNVIEAHRFMMELENIRIIKEMRNSVNRKVNCETANLNKTVSAAVKQIEDINYIEKTIGITNLPKQLREMAEIRLENPDATLKELGALMNPPVGKSGVNHRLKKIAEIAESTRVK